MKFKKGNGGTEKIKGTVGKKEQEKCNRKKRTQKNEQEMRNRKKGNRRGLERQEKRKQ